MIKFFRRDTAGEKLDNAEKELKLLKVQAEIDRLKKVNEAKAKIRGLYDAVIPNAYHTPKFDALNINETLAIEGQSLMQQARNLMGNNPIAVAIINQYQALLVGKNGYSLQPQPLLKDGSVDHELADQLAIAWAKFCEQPVVNAKDLNFMGLLNLIVSSWLVDGDVCLQILRDHKRKSFKVRLWTADRLAYANANPYGVQNALTDPIEVDDLGTPIRYNFKLRDEGLGQASILSVEARDVLHIAEKREAEQLRGATIFAPVLMLMEQIKLYVANEVIAGALNTQLLGELTQRSPDVLDDEGDVDLISLGEEISYFKVPNGFDFKMNPAQNRTNPSAGEFIKTMLRQVAGGVGLDAESISNAFESSYSAARQSMIYTEAKVAKKANLLIGAIIKPLYRAFVEFYFDTELLGEKNKSDYSWLENVIVNRPRLPSIDPVKDATANKLNLQMGTTTLEKLANEVGGNALDNLHAISGIKTLCNTIGIPEVFSALYGTSEAQNGHDIAEEEEEDENNNG